ncbi:nonstructural protein [Blackfly microvirus SF02]|uniref:Nonstructural protein n=1 Tax=Blackfly microvirus SF02 TaxID=2576452 RepID=A0A4P8PKK3_9VIRU|nr:nonstructural protein [Blackfly microvirus SF02]
MKLSIFVVKDRATDVFGQPMFLVSSGQAVRSFTDEINRQAEDNQLYRHPDDFDLYELGEFENEEGSFTTFAPRLVTRGKDVSLTFIGKN